MSGIVGIINLDGEPVNRELLEQMTRFITYRGPDAQHIWLNDHIGFGHTLLRTTYESKYERQPHSLENRLWITADARIDGRTELIPKLQAAGAPVSMHSPDVELLLYSYNTWGQDCLQHLLGDFAFAIWDRQQQRLICARDHFGIKPFYYARIGNCLVFSNTLNCIRQHPAVSIQLNQLAVADFLLFGTNHELDSTIFTDIQRLPPAHTLAWTGQEVNLRRYWTLPIDSEILYKRQGDYVEHFNEVWRVAVSDRLRTDKVSIQMSGGLDSTAVATTGHELLSEQNRSFDLQAFTAVCDTLIPDEERYYANQTAESLSIPIHFLVTDNYKLYERWNQPELSTPEPVAYPLSAISVDLSQLMGNHSRVVLTGFGGDPALYPSQSYLTYLVKSLQPKRLLTELGFYFRSYGRLPPLYLRTKLRSMLGKPSYWPTYPPWLKPVFADSLELKDRWRQVLNHINSANLIHPTHPEAYKQLLYPFWQDIFEGNSNHNSALLPSESRYPFFDLRLISYLLAIPAVPWCVNKEILRLAMKDRLPESVRLRPKTPLAGSSVSILLEQFDQQWLDFLSSAPNLINYIDVKQFSQVVLLGAGVKSGEAHLITRPISLAYWFLKLVRDESR